MTRIWSLACIPCKVQVDVGQGWTDQKFYLWGNETGNGQTAATRFLRDHRGTEHALVSFNEVDRECADHWPEEWPRMVEISKFQEADYSGGEGDND